ncbi:MAG TPA: bile acid:sodium symporter family protein [Bacteroidales bacterium]|nr:bile acid:sodium symporter family protein [Bacteroidales bacterium]
MSDMLSAISKFFNATKRFGLDWFILALLGVIILAYFWPHIGAKDSVVPLSQIATYGISVIFFFYGLKLSPQKVRSGLSNWRLHLVVQLATFVLFPLLVILAKNIIGSNGHEIIWMGVFFLASLPGTVSSAVVMVSIAKGNIPSAIFNASISTLMGVFITPLWMGIYLNTASADIDLGPILLKLTIQVIFPVVLGIILNPLWGTFAEKNSKRLRYFDQTIILLIVYTAFCESFAKKMFEGYSALLLVGLGAAMIVLFYAVYGIIYLASKILKFKREDKITALFCGSKKSLMHGTVMSKVLFAGSPYIGIVLLPVMMYHALQLVMVSIIAQWFARNKKSW